MANKKVRICRTFDKKSANVKSKAKRIFFSFFLFGLANLDGNLINLITSKKKITYTWQNIVLVFVPTHPDYFFWRVLEFHSHNNCNVSKGMKKEKVKRHWNWHGWNQSMVVASSWLTSLSLWFHPIRGPHQIPINLLIFRLVKLAKNEWFLYWKNQDFYFLHDFGEKNLNFQNDKLWIFTEN